MSKVKISTDKGDMIAELYDEATPITVKNFTDLIGKGFYNGLNFHRVIPNFVVQGGCPHGTGSGGPGYMFADELPASGEYKIGSLAMANSGANTNGSQFFVISGDQGVSLSPNYTLFGQVTDGLDSTVTALDAAGNPSSNGVPPLKEIKIESITITES